MIRSLSQTQQRLLGSTVVAAILLVGVSGVAVGTSGVVVEPSGLADRPSDVTGEPGSPILLQQSANNSSGSTTPPPHRNPEESRSEGSLDLLESVLRGSMNGNLDASTANLDDGDYERARQLLGSEYTEDLSRYRELSEDLDTQQQADLFATVRTDQQRYIDSVEAYERTLREYEQAREAGNSERARELAHELDRRAEAVDQTGAALESTYQTLGNKTDSEYNDRVSEIQTRRENVAATQTSVTERELTETTLSVTANQSTVTFQDSVTLSGELRTADGESVDREEIPLRVENQAYTTEIDSDGSFELTVEPATVWVETDSLQVAYRPVSSSELRGSQTSVPVSVSSTATAVRIDAASERASYDDPVGVTGVIATEGGQPVPGTPVALRVDGRQIGTAETTADGAFSFDRPIPSDVPTGETDLTVSVLPSSLALDASSGTTSLAIESTPTTVSVDTTTDANSGEIQVNGSLQSAAGRPIAEIPVRIQVAGTEVGVVETDANGEFTDRFALPAGSAGGNVQVTATAETPAGNLESTSDSTTVDVPKPLVGQRGVVTPTQIGLAGLLGLLGLAGGVGWWLRQQPTVVDSTTESVDSPVATDSDGQQELLTAAVDRLNEGADEAAATLAYAAVRHHLRDRVDSSETATHWEWYQACVGAGVDRLSDLETLTEAFEQVTFAPGETDKAASQAVTVAQTVVDTSE